MTLMYFLWILSDSPTQSSAHFKGKQMNHGFKKDFENKHLKSVNVQILIQTFQGEGLPASHILFYLFLHSSPLWLWPAFISLIKKSNTIMFHCGDTVLGVKCAKSSILFVSWKVLNLSLLWQFSNIFPCTPNFFQFSFSLTSNKARFLDCTTYDCRVNSFSYLGSESLKLLHSYNRPFGPCIK